VLLPMVLEKAPKPVVQEIAVHIPTIDRPAVTPDAPEQEPPKPVHEVTLPPVPAAVEKPPTAAPQPLPAAPEKPKSALTPAAHPAAGHYVQLGVFAKADNAKSVQTKWQKNGFKVHSDLVKTANGEGTRVRIGPFTSRSEADGVLQQVKRNGGHGAVVVSQAKAGR
jgi:DedD protein